MLPVAIIILLQVVLATAILIILQQLRVPDGLHRRLLSLPFNTMLIWRVMAIPCMPYHLLLLLRLLPFINQQMVGPTGLLQVPLLLLPVVNPGTIWQLLLILTMLTMLLLEPLIVTKQQTVVHHGLKFQNGWAQQDNMCMLTSKSLPGAATTRC